VDLTPFALFVSPVKGHLVSRFGTARADHGPSIIGGSLERIPEKDPNKPISIVERGAGRWSVDPKVIVALTHDEIAIYGREYSRAIKGGSLVRRTAAEFAEQQEQSAKAAKKARRAAEAQKKAAEAKASKSEE